MRFDSRSPGYRSRVSSLLLAFLIFTAFSIGAVWSQANTSTQAKPVKDINSAEDAPDRYLSLILHQKVPTATAVPAPDPTATPTATMPPTGSPAQRALARANYYRQIAGSPPLRLDTSIAQAAANHASYYVRNANTPGAFPNNNPHGEVAGYPGYTGVNFWDRMSVAGYQGNASFEVMHFITGPEAAVEDWVATVYHRIPFVNPRVTDGGYGEAQAGASAAVMDFGSTPGGNPVPDDVVSIFPADGQQDVPRAWDCREAPNPYADVNCSGANPVGYVITILPMGQQQFSSLTLHGPNNVPVAIHALRHDSGYKVWYAAAQQPLAANTSYTVTLSGTNNNGTPLTLQWTFTTGSRMYHNSMAATTPRATMQRPALGERR